MIKFWNGRFGLAAAVLAVIFGVQATGTVKAATCMDELDRFEGRLHGSGLAATDPDAFQSLARQAEETAELRDEEQCLQRVAELNATLPEDPGLQPVGRESPATGGTSAPDTRSRPAAPVLLIASDDEPGEEPENEQAEGDAVAENGNGNRNGNHEHGDPENKD